MKRPIILLIMISLLIICSFTIYAKTHVLIIGNGDYEDSAIRDLPGAIEDARKMRETLIQLEMANEQDIRVINNLPMMSLKINILEFLKKDYDKDDRLIVYFAGHSEAGINEAGKKDTYLCGVDVRKDHLQRTAYNFRQDFERIAADLQAKETIMIFGVSMKLLGI